jgi:hypothetical protein
VDIVRELSVKGITGAVCQVEWRRHEQEKGVIFVLRLFLYWL